MRNSSASHNVAFPWATLVAFATWVPSRQWLCHGSVGPAAAPSYSFRGVGAAASTAREPHEESRVSSSGPVLWRRPTLERAALVNGSLKLQALNSSGYCNSVCGSSMDYAIIADVSAGVDEAGVVATQLFLARLSTRLRMGQGDGHQLAGLIENAMEARLLTGLTDDRKEFVDAINKLAFRKGAMDLVVGLGMAETSFMYGRQHARSLVLAIVDGPVLRQRHTIQMAQKVSRSADLVVILVAPSYDVGAQRDAMEWLQAAGSCTPYGCRLLQVSDYQSLANVDTTGVLAEICRDLV